MPFEFAAKLVVVDPAAIRPGALVRGREIATLAKPLIHDNFEGLAVTREGNATILWIVSDDNQLFLQRSLLLKFRLEPDPSAAIETPIGAAGPLKRHRPASRWRSRPHRSGKPKRLGGDRRGAELLANVALQAACTKRELVVGGLDQPIVQAADMLDRAEPVQSRRAA